MVALDVEPGNYFSLQFADGKLFYMSRPFTAGGGRGNHGPRPRLKVYDLEEREAETVLDGVGGYTLSADGKKILYPATDGKLGIIDAKADQKPAEKPLRTDDMKARVDPRAEWRQIFARRLAPGARLLLRPGHARGRLGRDVRALRPLVPYVRPRRRLELPHGRDDRRAQQLGHTYVVRATCRGPSASAPACWAATSSSTATATATASPASSASATGTPATDDAARPPGWTVAAGDYLLAVDGVALTAGLNPYSLLVDKVGEQVVLRSAAKTDGNDSREITVEPIAQRARPALRRLGRGQPPQGGRALRRQDRLPAPAQHRRRRPGRASPRATTPTCARKA